MFFFPAGFEGPARLLVDSSKVNVLGAWYTSVNFGVRKSPPPGETESDGDRAKISSGRVITTKSWHA